MSLTRRDWAKVAAVAVTAVPQTSAQIVAPDSKEMFLNNTRAQVQSSARDLAAVKMPRATEPATRFEA